jgi:hypothetical protein
MVTYTIKHWTFDFKFNVASGAINKKMECDKLQLSLLQGQFLSAYLQSDWLVKTYRIKNWALNSEFGVALPTINEIIK